MKNVAKRLLCLVLVLMIAIPFAAFPAGAEDEIQPLYTVNFNGDSNMSKLSTQGWDGGMDVKRSSDGKSVSMTISEPDAEHSNGHWGNVSSQLNGLDIQNGAYTLVFTVTASDDNEEIGLLLDHQTGFVVNPGKNTFRYTDHLKGKTPIDTTEYNGNGELTQTYAIEVAGKGEGKTNNQPNVTITTYKLYNLTQDASGANVWNLAADISVNPGLNGFFFDWGYAGDCDSNLYCRLSRDRKNFADANDGTITVSNFTVYEGLVTEQLVVETRAYYLANDGDLLYTANFNGDDKYEVGQAWAGMQTKKVINGGSAIVLKPSKNDAGDAAVFGKEMDTTNYPAQGNSYTMVFTATASDANQEIGLYPDWSSGFVVVPGKNQFRYNKTLSDRSKNETIVDYTEYNGTGSLTQTYAIEYKLNDKFAALEYNLYVAQNGKWVLLYSLNAEELAAGPNWSTVDFETVIRFYRDSKIYNQTSGTVTVSNVKVYKGLAAKSGAAAVPSDAVNYSYDDSAYGQAIYKPNLGGDAVLVNPADGWTGLNDTVNAEGTALTLKPWNTNDQHGVWGAELNGYSIAGKSYTVVFSVRINANDHEIGFLPDGRTGFVIAPAYNEYRFITTYDEGVTEKVIAEGEYNVTKGEWDQTYAIEWKVDDDFNVVAYNLYISYAGEWVSVCKLDADALASLTAQEEDNVISAWNADNDVFELVFMRNQTDKKEIKVSDVIIYKGLGATIGKIPVASKILSYDKAENGDLLYNVDFNGTSNVFTELKDVYDGMDETVSTDGMSVDLVTKGTPSVSGSVWGGEMKGYTMPGNSYTVTFTLSAEDADQSVGVFLKWRDGFVITPGQNAYYVGHAHNNSNGGTTPIGSVYGISGTYNGSGALTQTYAIEIASGDSAGNDGKYECTAYNLYVLQDGVWVLVCSLNAEQRQKIAWNTTDPEFMIHLARISEADGENTGRVTVSDMKIYRGNDIFPELGAVTGASVRLNHPTGIRFTGSVNKAYLDALKAQYGADNVTIGMLITPTDYLVDNGLAFTKEALDACDAIDGAKYLEIDAQTVLDEGAYYKVNCAMVKVLEANYNRSFSARLYVKVNGEIVEYAKYNLKNNSRSIAEVSEAAYYDVKGTADGIYKYATTLSVGTTVYSPYQNRDVLKNFFEEEITGTSISVMTYNIRTYGDADSFWDKLTGNYEGWAGRDPKYALETITELMPDVIGLQEDDQNLYDQYKNVPAIAQNYERLNAGGNGNEGNEILYRKGVVSLVSTGTVSYKTLKDQYLDDDNIANADFSADTKGTNEAGRFFRWAILEKDGVQFIVVNTHLHYKASGSSSASDAINKNLRKAQATLIRRWLVDNEAAAECAYKIVIGDMNAQGDAQEMKYGFLNGNGALDLAKDNAIHVGDVGGTLISEGFTDRQPWVYDHIFFSGDTLTAFEYSVVDNYDASPAPTNYPSDHLPVIAKFICK